jgi:Uma2 family endonuclease
MYDGRMQQVGGPRDASDRRLTYDDFVRFPDDGRRHEIIDGKHYVTPSPNLGHQELIGRLHLEIGLYLRQHPGIGRVFLSPLDVLFTQWDIVEPDLLFVAADQTDILTELNVQGPPALVVEILSRGTRKRDLTIKRRLFDRGGVREYWAVDPKLHLVMVFARQKDGSFPQVATLSRDRDDVLTTGLLPGLTIQLNELFA